MNERERHHGVDLGISKRSPGMVPQGGVKGIKARNYGIDLSINTPSSNDNDNGLNPNSASDPINYGENALSDKTGSIPSDIVQNSRRSPGMATQSFAANIKAREYGKSAKAREYGKSASSNASPPSSDDNNDGRNPKSNPNRSKYDRRIKPSDNSQNGRRSPGMVSHSYIDSIKKQ